MTEKLFVDSINGKTVRLLYGKEEFTMPVSILPTSLKEGDTVAVTFNIDEEYTAKTKQKCEELFKMLLEGNSE